MLIGLFRFRAPEAVVLNKAISLVVVASALPFRAHTMRFGEVGAHWPIIVNLLAGSLLGAWLGAGWATRLRSETLYRVIAVMLVSIAAVLLLGHGDASDWPLLTGAVQAVVGGKLLIPTLVILFGADMKLAGSLSLAVSLPTMLAGFTRYSRDQSFSVLGRNRGFLFMMAVGSTLGTFVGACCSGSYRTLSCFQGLPPFWSSQP